jgi:hypothetical protein
MATNVTPSEAESSFVTKHRCIIRRKLDSPFVPLEYIFSLRKENVYLTKCFGLFGHHQVFLKFIYYINCINNFNTV